MKFSQLRSPLLLTEEAQRRSFILNVFLVGSIVLAIIASITSFLTTLLPRAHTSSPQIPFIVLLLFLGLYTLARTRLYILSAYFLVGIYFLSSSYTLYKYSIEAPQGLLILALTIIMSGVMISTRAAFVTAFLSVFLLFIISYLHINTIVLPNLVWKSKSVTYFDTIIFSCTLLIMTLVSWLSNREIYRNLKRARLSEAELKEQRDLLEITVEERTQELKQTQLQQVNQLYRFAELGKISSGLFHDLINPLTAVLLNLEHLNQTSKKDKNTNLVIKQTIEQAIQGTKRMEHFIQVVRKQIQKQDTLTFFSLAEEIHYAIDIMMYKARMKHINILFEGKDKQIYGSSLKLNQVITNLVSNAIDSYDTYSPKNHSKLVLVKLDIKNTTIIITVQDWGVGIQKDNLKYIFNPFFTTKGIEQGTGIGLSITQDIIIKTFEGTITVQSDKHQGSIFRIEFPVKTEPS